MIKYLAPLVIFIIMVVFLAIGLRNDPRYVPSPLIDKPAPLFELPQLYKPTSRFSPVSLKGRVWMLNAWTSDCPSCRAEHPWLLELQRRNVVPLIGLNFRDTDQMALAILKQHRNPYQVVVADHHGSVGIDYGVYAVPETFIIDKKGIIRFKHIGPIYGELLRDTIIPLLEKLKQESA